MLGYKLRELIWKGLKARGKAISTALDNYNAIASFMDHPAPLLEWKQLINYTFVSKFELLKYSSSYKDITAEPWAVPGNCEMTTKHFKVIGARAEIHRCKYEARRLCTSIRDEQLMYVEHISCVQVSDWDLSSEIQQQADTWARVNAYIIMRLDTVETLEGFMGIRGCGVHCGAMDVGEDTEGTPPLGVEEVIDRVRISVIEEAVAEGQVEDEFGGMDDGDLRDQLIEFSDAVAQEPPPSTNTIPNSMMFSWAL